MNQANPGKGPAPAAVSSPASVSAPAPAPAAPVVLQLSRGAQVVYTDTGAWLHPLLNLTQFLGDQPQDLSDHALYDKIIGRAAALLIVRLGIQRVHTETMSRRATPVFDRWEVAWSADRVVDRIDCRTEDILADEGDPERAFRVIRARATAALARSDASRRALSLDGVSVVRGDSLVLDDIDLPVGRGEKLLITGANGAGKTTLLETIVGIVPPSRGSVTLYHRSNGASPVASAAGRIGYVNQADVSGSLPICAEEVVTIGVAAARASRREKRERVRAAMAATGCTALAPRMYRTLSGGEKRRVTIARCLAQQAEILLLDEPTASLDGEAKGELATLLEELAHRYEITVILVTHEAHVIDHSGWRHLRLAHGTLSAAGAVE